jgi:hypothetical protein
VTVDIHNCHNKATQVNVKVKCPVEDLRLDATIQDVRIHGKHLVGQIHCLGGYLLETTIKHDDQLMDIDEQAARVIDDCPKEIIPG